uniref:Protein YIPF n=1 Tax=Skeletonema marinoi TaxID=267567 RepID=A0A7S2P342_9STRA
MGTTTSSTANAGYYGNTSNATTASSTMSGGGGMPMMTSGGSINTNTTNPMMMGNQSTQPAAPASTSYNNDGNMMMMSGAMGSGPIGGGTAPPTTSSSTPAPHIFDPNAAKQQQQQENNNNNNMTSIYNNYDEDYENEPPLLEELGVNFPHIYSKSRAVLFPIGKHAKSLEAGLIEDDADLAGPLAFALGLGGELVLVGKMHFGYVYGFGLSGCLAMTLLLNLLNPNGAVSMWTVVSILGYALLPVNLLAGINILYRVHKMNVVGMALAVLIILWCTAASTRLFERGCQMRDQRFLVAYPAALLYSAFVMITIF